MVVLHCQCHSSAVGNVTFVGHEPVCWTDGMTLCCSHAELECENEHGLGGGGYHTASLHDASGRADATANPNV